MSARLRESIRQPRAILALLTALNLLNYIDRFVLAAVLPLVQDELKISGFVAGGLATVFLIGYFVTSPIFGRLGDRTDFPGGRKGLLAAGVAVWSVATTVTGFAGGTPALVATRAVVGVGEAGYAAIAPTIIDDMAPAPKKGRWLSVFFLAIPVGSALGFIFGGLLGRHFGWRAAFFGVGAPGIVAAALCLLIAEPKRDGQGARERVPIGQSIAKLRGIFLYRRSVLGYAAQTFAVGGFGYWAPTFIVRNYGLPLDKASSTFGAILVLAGGLGTAIGGFWCDRWTAKAGAEKEDAGRIALRVCAIPSAAAALFAAACFWARTPGLFFALGFACELALFTSTSPVNAAILQSVPASMRSEAMAMSIFAIHLFGDLWSPPLLGWLQDQMPARIAMMGVPLALATSAAIWWIPLTGARPETGRMST